MSSKHGPTVVLGLGTPLMGDDAIGLALLERVRESFDIPGDVLLLDGGAWGLNLLPLIEGARRLLLLDALDAGAVPGTPIVLESSAVTRQFAAKRAPHEQGLRRVLGDAEQRGSLPVDLIAVGIQPGPIALGLELSASAGSALDAAAALVAQQLGAWGYPCTPHLVPA
jgi:hydrogenase maturation protease